MSVKPTSRDAVTAVLREHGPMNSADIADVLGWTQSRVNSTLSTARRDHPGKFFRVIRTVMRQGSQGRDAPVYSASPGPDAPRPPMNAAYHQKRNQRYYQQNRARILCRIRASRQGVQAASPWQGLVLVQSRAIYTE